MAESSAREALHVHLRTAMRMVLGTSIATLGAALALASGWGDMPPRPGRVVGQGAAARSTHSAVPSFAIFGWLSPPPEFNTPERMAEMAGVGINIALPSQDDPGRPTDNLLRLQYAAAHGIQCLIWDRRFESFFNLDPLSPQGLALIDDIAATYRDQPALLGYYLGDEPSPPWTLLERLHEAIRQRDPQHIAWNNLYGRMAFDTRDEYIAATEGYVVATEPSVLSYDHYDFLEGHDRGVFFESLAVMQAIARDHGLPLWSIVQLTPHGGYRALTAGEMRWQGSQILAYGARGIGYFTYWQPTENAQLDWGPAIINRDGTQSPWYDMLAVWNRSLRAAGETLADLTWLATEHAGSVPLGGTPFAPDDWVSAVEGRAALGSFVDGAGQPYLLVANSDSAAGQTVTLTLDRVLAVDRLGDDVGEWQAVPLIDGGTRAPIALESGGFALLRMEGSPAGVSTGHAGPVATVRPNPASGAVQFTLARLGAGANAEVLDASGRRVWSTRLGEGEARLIWHGERDEGGHAPSGLYFLRLEDARGVTSVRFTWLGR